MYGSMGQSCAGHKGRGADWTGPIKTTNWPNSCVAFLEARSVEKGGGQEREGDEAEVFVSGQELHARASSYLHPNGLVVRVGNATDVPGE